MIRLGLYAQPDTPIQRGPTLVLPGTGTRVTRRRRSWWDVLFTVLW